MSTERLKELYESRNKVWDEMKTLNDLISKENRDFTPEEDQKWDAMNADFDKHTADIEKIQKETDQASQKNDRQKKFEDRINFMKSSRTPPIKPEPDGQPQKVGFYGTEEYRNNFTQYLRTGVVPAGLQTRALQADLDASGGYLVVPEQFIAQLIQDLDNTVFVRQYAKVITMPKAASIGIPTLKDDIGDPSWTSELLVGSADTTMDFAKREMTPHPLARYIRVSKKLIRVAEIDIEALVRERLMYKFATVEENAFMNGTGVNSPLGVMISSAAGISAARDCSTGATTTAMTADHLWNCVYLLKAQYRKAARWAFHRDALKMIRKMKDGSGDYLWKAGIADGSPATICGYPYDESEYMPNAFTTTLYVGILGNWSYYWIVDALDMQVQVLVELFAATGENGYFARKETDAAPVLEDAFVRVKLG